MPWRRLALSLVVMSCGARPPGDLPVSDAGTQGETFGPCSTVEVDRLARCPFHAIEPSDEFVFIRQLDDGRRVVAAGSVGNAERQLIAAPEHWSINQLSVAPDREHLLVTAVRDDCAQNWPDARGESCTWGRGTLWLVSRANVGGRAVWEYRNLTAEELGANSTVIGWTTWLTPSLAIFNGRRADPGVPLMTSARDDASVVYAIDLERSPRLRRWGDGVGVNTSQCFIGRLHSSEPSKTKQCTSGQLVVMTRRCSDEPAGPTNFSWFNAVNDDGTGGQCRAGVGDTLPVPAFRVYVMKLDASCEPLAFDRTRPIRDPDFQFQWRHMGSGREWGDGQSTVSADGRWVAFWSQRGYDFSSPTDACEAFGSRDGSPGNGASRVRYCELDDQQRCRSVQTIAPTDAWSGQAHAYFHRTSSATDVKILYSEAGSLFLHSSVAGRSVVTPRGGGGHPVQP